MPRTLQKHFRLYADGYDLSGMARQIGPFGVARDEIDLTTWTDTTRGYLPNHSLITLGTLNAVFDNTSTTGLHAALGTAGSLRTVILALGLNAPPAQGDPTFCGQFVQAAYTAVNDNGAVTVTVPFNNWASNATTQAYGAGFGVLLHANSAATAVNSASGVDNPTGGATTTGGFFVYQVLGGNGTATLSVDDSADNSAFSALSGATSGAIDCSIRRAGLVALSNSATVRRYLRWQIAFGTATTVTFVSAFVRG